QAGAAALGRPPLAVALASSPGRSRPPLQAALPQVVALAGPWLRATAPIGDLPTGGDPILTTFAVNHSNERVEQFYVIQSHHTV
ncbi:hypothetical protein GW17_00007263, partial [Ensete ventricosum]